MCRQLQTKRSSCEGCFRMIEHPVELSEEVEELFNSFEDELNKGSHQSEKEYKAIKKAIQLLKTNPDYGDKIPAKRVSDKLVEDFGVNKNNVWRLEISADWRVIYTILSSGEVKLFALILKTFFSHKDYENYVFK